MNAPNNFNYDASAGSSTSGATMLLILQILPQLDVLKRCRDGWKSIADIAKDEIETLRLKIAREQIKFKQLEYEYNVKMSSLAIKIQRAYDEKYRVKNILLDTTVQLKNMQNHSTMIAVNFSKEKQNLMKLINESNNYVLNNREFFKNISIQLRMILNNETYEYNSTYKTENNLEQEIRDSLDVLTKFIQNMKKELLENNIELNEATKTNNKLTEENKGCLSSNEELQEELREAKETEENLSELKEEKQQFLDINQHLLKQILSIVEETSAYQNLSLETMLKQTSSATRGIQKYIVEPAEDARNATLHSILKNRTKEAALISAAKKGNVTEMSILLDYGADIEGGDDSELNLKPLHWVSYQGHWKAVRLLLLRGADVNARSKTLNASALHIAAEEGHHNVIDLLLKAGADIEARDEFGFTPLFRAIKGDCATVKLLVDRGANVSTTNDKGVTAVAMATDCVRELLCSKGAIDPICRTEETATASLPCG